MKKIAFFVSSAGDTDLALSTIRALETKGEHQFLLIALTKNAEERIAGFNAQSLTKQTLLTDSITDALKLSIVANLKKEGIEQVFIGIPSEVNFEVPEQLALILDDFSVLMAYEFMFKPAAHRLWSYLPALKSKPNIHWAIPLNTANEGFGEVEQTHVIGHLSIDRAYASKAQEEKISEEDLRADLQLKPEQSLALISSSTIAYKYDKSFLDCVLSELPNHPNIQVRLSLHPNIQDFDAYLKELLTVYDAHEDAKAQFQIIFPPNLFTKLKYPELTVNHPSYQAVFLKVKVPGQLAATIADRVGQAVPGALLNQALLEGKPAYSLFGTPYLSGFSSTVTTFFSNPRRKAPLKSELDLDEKTAGERCAEVLMRG